jgi:DHA2 family multidrug resistance protein
MRNIGGSIGIATSKTLLFRREQFHTNLPGAHVNPLSLQTQTYLHGLQTTLIGRGSDPVTAMHQSYGIGMLQRQAAVGSFVDTFAAMAAVFLLGLPLLFLMKKPGHHSAPPRCIKATRNPLDRAQFYFFSGSIT